MKTNFCMEGESGMGGCRPSWLQTVRGTYSAWGVDAVVFLTQASMCCNLCVSSAESILFRGDLHHVCCKFQNSCFVGLFYISWNVVLNLDLTRWKEITLILFSRYLFLSCLCTLSGVTVVLALQSRAAFVPEFDMGLVLLTQSNPSIYASNPILLNQDSYKFINHIVWEMASTVLQWLLIIN